jgi:chromosome segregation ATPase
MADLRHLSANLEQKRSLRTEADARLRDLSAEAMKGEHDEFGSEQINEKLAAVRDEIEALDVEIAKLESQIANDG